MGFISYCFHGQVIITDKCTTQVKTKQNKTKAKTKQAMILIRLLVSDSACDSKPCINSGTCSVLPDEPGYNCTCTDGYYGQHCQCM